MVSVHSEEGERRHRTDARSSRLASAFLLLCLAGNVASAAEVMPAEDIMQFADGLFARSMYELAVEEYGKLLEKYPDYERAAEAHYRLGDAYRQLGKGTDAQKQYGIVFKQFPETEYALKAGLKRADIFVKEGHVEGGIELYRLVLKKNPDEGIASACSYFIGEALLSLTRTNDAVIAYEAVTKSYPDSDYAPFALLRLAEIGAARGAKPEELLKHYRAAAETTVSERAAAEALYQIGRIQFGLKAFEASSGAFAELAKRYPDDERTKESRLDAAWAQYSAGLTAVALRLADESLAAGPSEKMKAEWMYLKANCERSLKKYRDAIRTYGDLMKTGGESLETYLYEKALCHFYLEEYEEVLSQLGEGVSKFSKAREDVLWLKARASEETGKGDSAVQFYSKLLEESSDGRFSEEASYRLAGILRQRKEWNAAAALYSKVASDYPKGAMAPRALLAEGVCRAAAGAPDKAVTAWKKVCREYPESELVPEALLNTLVAEIGLKRQKDARQSVTEFLAKFAQHRKANEGWFWKGVIEAGEAAHKEAEKAFSRAIELNIEGDLNSKARAFRAMAIYRAGDLKRAADELQRLTGRAELKHAGRNIFVWLAGYRLDQGDAEKSVEAAKRVLELSEVNVEVQEANCLYGRALTLANDPAGAVKAYQAAFAIEDASMFRAEAALRVAESQLNDGDAKAAASMFKTAAELAGGDVGVAVRARAYYGLGQSSEMLQEFEQAARYFMSVAVLFDDPETVPKALRAAVRCYGRAGMERERERTLQELKERYPGAKEEPGND